MKIRLACAFFAALTLLPQDVLKGTSLDPVPSPPGGPRCGADITRFDGMGAYLAGLAAAGDKNWTCAAVFYQKAADSSFMAPGIGMQAMLASVNAGDYEQAVKRAQSFTADAEKNSVLTQMVLVADAASRDDDEARRYMAAAEGRRDFVSAILMNSAADPSVPLRRVVATELTGKALAHPAFATFLLRTALLAEPESAPVREALAESEIEHRQYDSAIHVLEAIPPSVPEYESSRHTISCALAAAGRKEEERQVLETLTAERPSLYNYMMLGRHYAAAQEHEKAILSFTDGLGYAAGNAEEIQADTYLGRALSHEKLGHREQAEDDMQKAVAIIPEADRARARFEYELAHLWLEQGENETSAVAVLERVAQMSTSQQPPDFVSADLGWAYDRAGDHKKAIAVMEEAIERNGWAAWAPSVAERLGDAYWADGQRERARLHWARALNDLGRILDSGNADIDDKEDVARLARVKDKLARGLSAAPESASPLPSAYTPAPG